MYPTIIIPITQINTNIFNNFGFIAFLSIIKEGKDKVVTAIIKAKILPKFAPLKSNASAIGIVPNISA